MEIPRYAQKRLDFALQKAEEDLGAFDAIHDPKHSD